LYLLFALQIHTYCSIKHHVVLLTLYTAVQTRLKLARNYKPAYQNAVTLTQSA